MLGIAGQRVATVLIHPVTKKIDLVSQVKAHQFRIGPTVMRVNINIDNVSFTHYPDNLCRHVTLLFSHRLASAVLRVGVFKRDYHLLASRCRLALADFTSSAFNRRRGPCCPAQDQFAPDNHQTAGNNDGCAGDFRRCHNLGEHEIADKSGQRHLQIPH